jgi:hypothetical protein
MTSEPGTVEQDGPGGDGASPAHTVREALSDAREHARLALVEALRALACLIEAAGLAAAGPNGSELPGLGRARELLEAAARSLEEPTGSGAASLLEAVAEALDAEVARWEERARVDPEARAVLRAFLGLRELLWELGVRPRGSTRPTPDDARGGGPRVQRVPVED